MMGEQEYFFRIRKRLLEIYYKTRIQISRYNFKETIVL